MIKTVFIVAACVMAGVAGHSFAASQMIACPALTVKHYGKNAYVDSKTGQTWRLTWFNKQTPAWSQVSIPHTTLCGVKKSSNGIPVHYQCAVFQCKSNAVIASLGQYQPLKCFSAYVSTRNAFYCDSFSMN